MIFFFFFWPTLSFEVTDATHQHPLTGQRSPSDLRTSSRPRWRARGRWDWWWGRWRAARCISAPNPPVLRDRGPAGAERKPGWLPGSVNHKKRPTQTQDYFCYSVSAFTANLHDSLTITDCFSFPLGHCKRSHKASCKQLFNFSVQTLSQRAESLTLCIIDLPRAFAPSRPRQDDLLAPDRSRSESTLPPRLQWELDTSTLAEPVWPGWEWWSWRFLPGGLVTCGSAR